MPSLTTAATTVSCAPILAASRPGGLRFWLQRYVVQDLASKLAVFVWAWLLLPIDPAPVFTATSSAIIEIATFYAVIWVRGIGTVPRRTGARAALCLAIVREYGPAELVDLAVRPAAMGLALARGLDAVPAVLVGSVLADVAFYCTALLACRVGALVPR